MLRHADHPFSFAHAAAPRNQAGIARRVDAPGADHRRPGPSGAGHRRRGRFARGRARARAHAQEPVHVGGDLHHEQPPSRGPRRVGRNRGPAGNLGRSGRGYPRSPVLRGPDTVPPGSRPDGGAPVSRDPRGQPQGRTPDSHPRARRRSRGGSGSDGAAEQHVHRRRHEPHRRRHGPGHHRVTRALPADRRTDPRSSRGIQHGEPPGSGGRGTHLCGGTRGDRPRGAPGGRVAGRAAHAAESRRQRLPRAPGGRRAPRAGRHAEATGVHVARLRVRAGPDRTAPRYAAPHGRGPAGGGREAGRQGSRSHDAQRIDPRAVLRHRPGDRSRVAGQLRNPQPARVARSSRLVPPGPLVAACGLISPRRARTPTRRDSGRRRPRTRRPPFAVCGRAGRGPEAAS